MAVVPPAISECNSWGPELDDVEEAAAEEEVGNLTAGGEDVTPASPKPSLRQFDVLKEIGKGAFSKVYLVQKRPGEGEREGGGGSSTLYAMKVTSKHRVLEEKHVQRLFSERNILRRLDHPFIVRLYYTFQTDCELFFVLSYKSGGDLNRYLHATPHRCVSERLARFYAAEITLALQFLHSHGVVYRDLKPHNLLLDEKGHLCLADMGLSKAVSGDSPLSRCCESKVGTPAYVAPDVLTCPRYGVAADWWSFGVLLFRMLTGRTPFRGRTIPEIFTAILTQPVDFTPFPWVSPTAVDLIASLLRKDSKLRATGSQAQAHAFFHSVDWGAALARTHDPPDYHDYNEPPTSPEDTLHPYQVPAALLSESTRRPPLEEEQQKAFAGFSLLTTTITTATTTNTNTSTPPALPPLPKPRRRSSGGSSSSAPDPNPASASSTPTPQAQAQALVIQV